GRTERFALASLVPVAPAPAAAATAAGACVRGRRLLPFRLDGSRGIARPAGNRFLPGAARLARRIVTLRGIAKRLFAGPARRLRLFLPLARLLPLGTGFAPPPFALIRLSVGVDRLVIRLFRRFGRLRGVGVRRAIRPSARPSLLHQAKAGRSVAGTSRISPVFPRRSRGARRRPASLHFRLGARQII